LSIAYRDGRLVDVISSPEGGTRVVAVDRLRPGDHACLNFGNNDERWEVLASFARIGFARGEKVAFLVDAATTLDEAVERIGSHGAFTGSARAALERRQLMVFSLPRYAPGTEFDLELAISLTLAAIDQAHKDGFPGVRAADDMTWTLQYGMDLDQMMGYEQVAHRRLFAGKRFTGICQYDKKRFGRQFAATMSAIHPVTLLDRPGALSVTRTRSGIRLAGEADVATHQQFITALEEARARSGSRLVVDTTDLSFMDAHSATAIITMASRMAAHEWLEVRCTPPHRRIFRALGAGGIPQLLLTDG
jgi:anti-anti-sigma factor